MSKTAREVILECSLGCDMDVDHLFESLESAGFVIVPKKATAEMIEAARKSRGYHVEGYATGKVHLHPDNIWNAMIAEFEKPPAIG